MSDWTEFDLGEVGRKFLLEKLSHCSGELEILLTSAVKRPGRIFAPLPSDTPVGRVLNFERGGTQSISKALGWLVAKLKDQADGTLFLCDTLVTPSEIKKNGSLLKHIVLDEAVCFCSPSREISIGELSEIHKEIRSFQLVGFFVPRESDTKSGKQYYMYPRRLARIGANASLIFVSSYDQESWVVWERFN